MFYENSNQYKIKRANNLRISFANNEERVRMFETRETHEKEVE